MKVLILSDIEAGGEWIATQTLIEKLIKKDERIKFYLIASSKKKNLLKESLFEKIIYIRHKYYKKPFKYYRELFYQLIEGAKTIDKVCKRQVFDYVITIDYILAISYLISQKKLNYIYYFHGIKNDYKIFSDTFNHYMILRKLLEILAWTMSKKIIIPSVQAKTYLINNYGLFLKKKTFMIVSNLIRNEFNNKYSQIEINQLKRRFGIKNEKIILYSGRLALNKGIRNLLYAFLKITNKYPEVILIIAYFGKPETRLINKIKALIKKGGAIKLVNNLKTVDLAKLYQFSYLGILPSLLEMSSLFIREALMCDLPIISTNTGDTNNILSNHFILEDNKTNTIYNKIGDFFNIEYKYKKIFLKIKKRFKFQYNEEKIINSWIKVLKTYET